MTLRVVERGAPATRRNAARRSHDLTRFVSLVPRSLNDRPEAGGAAGGGEEDVKGFRGAHGILTLDTHPYRLPQHFPKAIRVESRRPEPQEPRAHRARHDRGG